MTLEEAKIAVESINQFTDLIDDAALGAQQYIWFRNMAHNLNLLQSQNNLLSLKYSSRQLAAKTVLIVGSGPSLLPAHQTNLTRLWSLDPETFTVTGVTNLAWCLKNKIYPDAVLVADANPILAQQYNRTIEVFHEQRHTWKLILPVFHRANEWHDWKGPNTGFYLPTIMNAELFNQSVYGLWDGRITSWLHQSGSAVNMGLVYGMHLQERGVPLSRALLAGVDFAIQQLPDGTILGRVPKVNMDRTIDLRLDPTSVPQHLPEYRELFEWSDWNGTKLLTMPPNVQYKNDLYGKLGSWHGTIELLTPRHQTILEELPQLGEPYDIQHIIQTWLKRWPDVLKEINRVQKLSMEAANA